MRDFVLATLIFGSLPLILIRPWIGILMWCWISFMNPHRLAWGYMYDLEVGMIIAVATLIGWVIAKEDRRVPVSAITVFMAVLVLWSCVTTALSVHPEEGVPQWIQYLKIILMTFVLMSLMKSEERFRALVWVMALSIGYFGIKGGLFTLLTGGQFRVWGPPATFISDNNALALGLVMVIPLLVYLGQTTEHRWVRLCMYGFATLCLISVVGSYSRGGFLGLAAIAVLLWTRSKHKWIIGVAAALSVAVALSFVPQKWFDRMETIQNYETDESAMGRLEIWGHAVRIANDSPIVGGGFGAFYHDPTYDRLSPEIMVRRNVHSIYFEMLGTQGYVGLGLFLLLGLSAMLTARRIKRLTRGKEGLEKEYKFANMIQISLVAYAVAGAFQNLSTWDGYYTILAMIALQYALVKEKLKRQAPAAARGAAGAASTGAPGAGSPFLRPQAG